MIFKHQARRVVDGRKRQTRRPVKPGDKASHDENGKIVSVYRNGRLLWKVGQDYAVQPDRGKRSIGRTPPIKEIRRERLQEITNEDVIKEGCFEELIDSVQWIGPYRETYYKKEVRKFRFIGLWNSLYRKLYRWEDNPEVWCLSFELAEKCDALA